LTTAVYANHAKPSTNIGKNGGFMKQNEQFIRMPEAVKIAGVNRNIITAAIARGDVIAWRPATGRGARYNIDPCSLRQWIKSRSNIQVREI